jgi:hypothetical protein
MVDSVDRDVIRGISQGQFSLLGYFADLGHGLAHDVLDGTVVEISFLRALHIGTFELLNEVNVLVGLFEDRLDHCQHAELGFLLPLSD